MRLSFALLLGLVLPAPHAAAAPPAVRLLPGTDLAVFACAPSPTHRMIGSEAALATVLASLTPHCSTSIVEQRKARFLRSLERTHLNWSEEVLVIAQDWYGTGMAKPVLAFSGPSERVLIATIQWQVPPPPLTPDTASCRFAFAVRRSAVTVIKVGGHNSGTVTFTVSP